VETLLEHTKQYIYLCIIKGLLEKNLRYHSWNTEFSKFLVRILLKAFVSLCTNIVSVIHSLTTASQALQIVCLSHIAK
jgi:hypothetical protein